MATPTTLAEYYTQKGQTLPTWQERAPVYESLGLGLASTYTGSLTQNQALLQKLLTQAPAPAPAPAATQPLSAVVGGGSTGAYGQQGSSSVTTPTPAAVPPATNPPPATSGYTGVSIVDYLNSVGQPSDYTSRAKLAAQYGIANYVGSADQNTSLLAILQGKASPINAGPGGTTGGGTGTTGTGGAGGTGGTPPAVAPPPVAETGPKALGTPTRYNDPGNGPWVLIDSYGNVLNHSNWENGVVPDYQNLLNREGTIGGIGKYGSGIRVFSKADYDKYGMSLMTDKPVDQTKTEKPGEEPTKPVAKSYEEIRDEIYKKYNIDTATKDWKTNPTKSFEELYKDLYNTLGLADVKAKIDALTAKIDKANADYKTAVSDINDNPWVSESGRVGKIEKLNINYNNTISGLNNTLTLLQNQMDRGREEATNTATRALAEYDKNKQYQKEELDYLINRATADIEAKLSSQSEEQKFRYETYPDYLKSLAEIERIKAETAKTNAEAAGGGGKLTETEKKKQDVQGMGTVLESWTGEDGYVSPEKWKELKNKWVSEGGYTADSFIATFYTYINPADPQNYGTREQNYLKGAVSIVGW